MASRPVAGGWEVSLRYHGGFEKGFRQMPPIVLPIDVQILVSQNFGVLKPLQRFSGCCIFLHHFQGSLFFGVLNLRGSRNVLEKFWKRGVHDSGLGTL